MRQFFLKSNSILIIEKYLTVNLAGGQADAERPAAPENEPTELDADSALEPRVDLSRMARGRPGTAIRRSQSSTGLLFVRRNVLDGSTKPPLYRATLLELKDEFDRRCHKQPSLSASDRLRIRDTMLRDAGGIQYDHIEHEFQRLSTQLKWPDNATIKDFRHLFSTLKQNAGLPEYYRRYLMGHSPGRAAIVSYTHLNELRDHYESAAEKKLAPIVAAIQSRLSILDIGP